MATRHRTPVAPGYRAWAACVIVLQCERGGRPVTAVYGFWALLYAAFGAQDLSDEAATTSLLGALAAAFALAVRVIATMSMGEGRAAAAEVALHCLGCAGVAFAAWALVHDAAAPADAILAAPRDDAPPTKINVAIDAETDDDDDMEDMFVDTSMGKEWGGPTRGGRMPEPTRFGDWERKGRATDF